MVEKSPSNKADKYFTWSDAWIFVSLSGASDETGHVSFMHLMARSDMLNHLIFSADELKQALIKLHMRGLLKSDGDKIMVTELTTKLLDEISKKRGGASSSIDNALKVLNSSHTRLPVVEGSPFSLTFISDSFINNIYKDYVTWLQNTQAKGRK